MRYRLIAFILLAFSAVFCTAAMARRRQDPMSKGCSFSPTIRPSRVRPGTTSPVNLKLHNYGLPPERLNLSVAGVPGLDGDADGRRPAGRARRCRRPTPASRSNCGSTCRRMRRSARRPHGQRAGRRQQVGAAGRGDAGQGFAGQADARRRSFPNCAAPRSRASSFSSRIKNDSGKKLTVSLAAAGAAEFRRHVHRAIRQPGAQRRSGRCRPDQGREAQGAPAEHGRGRQVQGRGARSAPRTRRPPAELALDITGQPKLDIAGREGLLSARATAGKETSIPVIIDQYRHRAGRADRAVRLGAGRLEGRVRAEDDRSHRPEREQGSAGADHADRQGDRRRLRDDACARRRAANRPRRPSASRSTTSTMWGIAGVGIIGVALLVMVGAVARFGRR